MSSTVRRSPGQALYRRIAEQLREAIYRGELAPGERLPSEQELMDRHDVSRNTVRLALAALTSEGLIASSQGRGSFVREHAPLRFLASQTDSRQRRARSTRDAFMSDVTEQGRVGGLHIEVAIVRADATIAAPLELDEGSSVVVRRRVQSVDDEPYATADTYFPLELVKDSPITDPDDIPQGANKVLDDLGHAQVRFHDEITTRMPTADEARKLRIGPGTPVASLARVGYDTDDVPVRLFITVLPGDRYTVVYDVAGD
ncbi:MAG: GntR family transcriptional regulator [Conexibacteraceae bacterium]|nr:GntR family transcriptional regulator [Conexibacteraceae bacterium]